MATTHIEGGLTTAELIIQETDQQAQVCRRARISLLRERLVLSEVRIRHQVNKVGRT
jgi:uncharacterized protein YbcI